MIKHIHKFRVAYPDTDKMGTVHHSNYAKYYEVARWELLRHIGISYQSMEKAGYMLPVIGMSFKFLKTTRYDELLSVHTTLTNFKGPRIWFSYKLFNEMNELINEAETELVFVGYNTFKPCIIPDFIKSALEEHMHAQAPTMEN